MAVIVRRGHQRTRLGPRLGGRNLGKCNISFEICLRYMPRPAASSSAVGLETVQRRQCRRCTSPSPTLKALRARAGGVRQVSAGAPDGRAWCKSRGWLLTTLSESIRCSCPVSAHFIAVLGVLGSHPAPLMHHAALALTHVERRALAATNHVRARRFSCTGT